MFRDDLRHASRRLRSRPGSLAISVAMLGLGIGLTTAMFSIVDALLLRPLPFSDPDRLAQISMWSKNGGREAVSSDVFRAWRASPAFDDVQGASTETALIETPGGLVSKPGAFVSTGLFQMLGVHPIRGRAFQSDEGGAGADDRVVIAAEFWRTAFAGDPDIVGHRITVDGQSLAVVGVMAAGFRFPTADTVLWRPIDFLNRPAARAIDLPVAYVRLARAMPEVDALKSATDAARAVEPANAGLSAVRRPVVGTTLESYVIRAVRLLTGGVLLVFLVLCANVSSLILARMAARRREYGVCAALGASRGRLLRQALLENVLLGACASLLGVAAAWALVAIARGFLPVAFLQGTLNPMNIDVRALTVASALGVLATLCSGVLPAWIGTRAEASDALRASERSGTDTRAARIAMRVLLVGETALACTLLVGATLLVISFIKISTADRGLDTRGVITAWVSLPRARFRDTTAKYAAASAIDEMTRAMPSVRQVVLSYGVPPGGADIHFSQWVVDSNPAPFPETVVGSYDVGPDFFTFYGIRLIKGRTFQSGEPSDSAVIGERLAKTLWPGQDPVGRSFKPLEYKTWYHVVGVVQEISTPSLNPNRDLPEFYSPLLVRAGGSDQPTAFGTGNVMVSIRCNGPCPEPARLRQRVLTAAPGAVVAKLGALDDAYREETDRPRAAAALAFVFAVIGVIASAGGLFSVLSYAVGRRTREFGVRSAMGAEPAQLRRLVLRDGLNVAITGAAIGCAGAWLLSNSLASLEYDVSATSPVVWITVTSVVFATSILSSWRPARQAGRVDPAILLRED